MIPHFKSELTFSDYFKEEKTCIEFLQLQRWNGKPVCPYCKSDAKHYIIEGGKRHKCANKECHRKFSVKVGTIFENSNIKLRLWFKAIWLLTNHKKGISSLTLHRELGVTQKTAWFMLHRIREMVREKAPEMLTGTVLVDETGVGGEEKNRHADKKTKGDMKRGSGDKTAVMGLLSQTQNKVMTFVVPNAKKEILQPIVYKRILPGSLIVSDEHFGYLGLEKDFKRDTHVHSKKEYKTKKGNSTNQLEGYWSLMKRMIYGIYHHVSPAHLQRYSDESSFRYNTRQKDCSDRFVDCLKHTDGRLKYADLIDKK